MIDALSKDLIEQGIRNYPENEVAIENFDKYFDQQGRNSVVNYDDTTMGLLDQYVSKAGRKGGEVVRDYNVWRVKTTKRERQKINFKTSIVMSSYGHAKECAQAIDSICDKTKVPYELIVSDNKPEDTETIDMLKSKKDSGKITKLILNETNLGDMGALIEGMKQAEGEHYCMVNNDIIVCEGWLDAMLQCAIQEEDAGLVSARTNNISGVQMVLGAPSTEMMKYSPGILEIFNTEWKKQHSLGWWKYPRIRSMVMLITRRHIDEMDGKPLLDVAYGMGNFDDDDICMETLTRGLQVYIADESYISHWGSLSFGEDQEAFAKSLEKNFKTFKEKWQEKTEEMEKVLMCNHKPIRTLQDIMSWKLQ